MKKLNLQYKMILQSLGICIVLISIFIYSTYRQSEVTESYHEIAINQFPKVTSLSKMIASFRLIRINVRSLGLSGNTNKDQLEYSKKTKSAISDFLKEKSHFDKMAFSDEEKLMVKNLDSGWSEFLAFGGELLSQYDKPTKQSLLKGAYMIREVCPIKAAKWMNVAEKFLKYQQDKTSTQVKSSVENKQAILILSISLLALSSTIAIIFSYFFSKSIFIRINKITLKLLETVKNVTSQSETIKKSSGDLTAASDEASESIGETVSSITQISAMAQKNSQSASRSSEISSKSNHAAHEGKLKVDSMIKYVDDIAHGNTKIAHEVKRNNEEISQIVTLISQIGEKTKVINDIVFQTKLLSFNASVEAARAGEHGKGFAVVAEEVGSLASMSGGAASEISQMLDTSTQQVGEIIENAKTNIQRLVDDSQVNIDKGRKGALDCGASLDEILSNVNSVSEMVEQIASASKEQSKDVEEVTYSIELLDRTTQKNSSIAKGSSQVAQQLEAQANDLSVTIDELSHIISGG